MSMKIAIAGGLLLAGVSPSALAGNGTWTSTGPDGGNVTSVAVSAPNALAGTAFGGMYRSTDSGVTWTWLDAVTGRVVKQVAFMPGNALVALAIVNGSVQKSTDGGETWSPSTSGLSGTVMSLSFVDGDVYAGTEINGLYRSQTGGDSWTHVDGLTMGYISRVVKDGQGALYAGGNPGNNGGVKKSTDSGATWNSVNTGLTDTVANPLGVGDLAAASTGTVVWAAVNGGGEIKSIKKTTNGGASWTDAGTGLPAGTYAQGVQLGPSDVLYALMPPYGLYRSTDGGGNWAASQTGLSNRRVNALAFGFQVALLGTDGGGVFRSADASTWSGSSSGLHAANITSLFSPGQGWLLAGTDAGFYRTTDAGATWQLLNAGLVDKYGSVPKVLDVVSEPGDVHNLYAATSGGFFVSANDGSTWTASNGGLDVSNPPQFTKLGLDPDSNPDPYIYAATSGGPVVSVDGGATWAAMTHQKIVSRIITELSVILRTNVLAATSTGVVRSTDGGATWADANQGLVSTDCSSLQVDTTSGTEALVGTSFGVYRSQDAGLSWTARNNLMTSLVDLSMAHSRRDTVYATRGFPAGVYQSTNLGSSFTQVNTGLEALFAKGYSPGKVAADYLVSTNAYVALPYHGVFAMTLTGNGDADGNGTTNVSDILYLINRLFAGGPAPAGTGDVNGDGVTNVSDVLYLINYLFAAGPPPH